MTELEEKIVQLQRIIANNESRIEELKVANKEQKKQIVQLERLQTALANALS